MMVLSKSFSVLRSAVTPRVMPPTIDLVRVNSRLTMFGLLGGTIVGGAIAAGVEYLFKMFDLPGALFVCVAVTVAGAVLSMRIPNWVEVTEGEVPTTLSYHAPTELITRAPMARQPAKPAPTTVGPQHHHRAVGQLHHQGDGRLPVPVPGVRRQGRRRRAAAGSRSRCSA